MREALTDKDPSVNGEVVKSSLELRKHLCNLLAKHRRCSSKLYPRHRRQKKTFGSRGQRSMSYVDEVSPQGGKEPAAMYVVADAWQAEEGWKLVPEVLGRVSDSFVPTLFESFLNES